jgi:hypothetical protein
MLLEGRPRRVVERLRPPCVKEREIGAGCGQGKDDNEDPHPSACGAPLRDHSHILSIHFIEYQRAVSAHLSNELLLFRARPGTPKIGRDPAYRKKRLQVSTPKTKPVIAAYL